MGLSYFRSALRTRTSPGAYYPSSIQPFAGGKHRCMTFMQEEEVSVWRNKLQAMTDDVTEWETLPECGRKKQSTDVCEPEQVPLSLQVDLADFLFMRDNGMNR